MEEPVRLIVVAIDIPHAQDLTAAEIKKHCDLFGWSLISPRALVLDVNESKLKKESFGAFITRIRKKYMEGLEAKKITLVAV